MKIFTDSWYLAKLRKEMETRELCVVKSFWTGKRRVYSDYLIFLTYLFGKSKQYSDCDHRLGNSNHYHQIFDLGAWHVNAQDCA